MIRIEKEYEDIYKLECPYCHRIMHTTYGDDTDFCEHVVYLYDTPDNVVLKADSEWINKIKPILAEQLEITDIGEYISDGCLNVDEIESALLASGRTDILDTLTVEIFPSDGYSGEVVWCIFDSKEINVKEDDTTAH